MKSFHKIFIAYMIFAVIIGTFGWMPQTAKAYTTLAEWQFNGDYLDHVGQYNGTASGTGISIANNYLSLTSAGSDKVTIGDADAFSFTDGVDSDLPFSVAAWVKVNSVDDEVVILSKVNNDAGLEYDFTLKQGILRFALYDNSGVYTDVKYQETPMSSYPNINYIDTWVHVAATYDGIENANGMKLYMNGSLLTSNPTLLGYSGMANTTAPVVIGNRYINGTQIYSDGAVDNVKLISTELTPTEVYNIYNSEAAEYRSALINVNFWDGGSPIQSNVFALDTEPAFTYIYFTPVKSVDAGDGIIFTMGTGIQLGTIDETVSTVSQMNAGTNINIGLGGIETYGQDIKIIVSGASDHPAEKITYAIPANATYTLKTPLAAGPQVITARVYDLGTDNAWGGVGDAADVLESQASAASIFGSYQVDISATVDATLSLELANWYSEPQNAVPVENGTAGTCSFGTMDTTQVRLCLYNIFVDTNADFGYTAFIRDTGNFAKDGTTDIDDSSGTISPGTEGYGVATSSTYPDKVIATINDFDLSGAPSVGDVAYLWDPANRATTGVNATAVTEIDKSIGGASGPVDNNPTTVMHMVNISGTTEAGVYSTTTIITVVGNF